jgi:GAF domain-containing protein/two-component sensor histidine kinase
MVTIETTQTLDTLLHQILNQALVEVGAEGGSLMLVDNKRGILQIKARLGVPRPGRKTEVVFNANGPSIAAWVVQSKRSHLSSNVETDDHFVRSGHGQGFRSLLSVPIVHEDAVLAVINADHSCENYFNENHRRALEALASQVAEPIANRISILDAVAQVGAELTRSPREAGVDGVLQLIASLAVRSLGADLVTLYQYVQAEDEFPVEGKGPVIAGDIRDTAPTRGKIHKGDVPRTMVERRESGFYSDVHKYEFLTCDVSRPDEMPRKRFVDREGIKSVAALLLPFRATEDKSEEVVGVMFANYRNPHDFNIDEVSALATFADYAAMAILNARHEEQKISTAKELARGLSYSLRTRSAALRARISNLAYKLGPSHKADINSLYRATDFFIRVGTVASKLTRLEGTQSGGGEKVDVNAVLTEMVEALDDPRITLVPMDRPVSVWAERQYIEDSMMEIVWNACEFAASSTGQIKLTVSTEGGMARIDCEDNGQGIHPDFRPDMFKSFKCYPATRMGFGLFYADCLIKLCGGTIGEIGTWGIGAHFVVRIPLIEGEQE